MGKAPPRLFMQSKARIPGVWPEALPASPGLCGMRAPSQPATRAHSFQEGPQGPLAPCNGAGGGEVGTGMC